MLPLLVADRALAPLRGGLLRLTDFLFRVTHFHDLRAAPYITDEELKSVLSQEHESGIEEDGRQMICRILEFRDVQLREILVPRPDIIAVPEDATIEQALAITANTNTRACRCFATTSTRLPGSCSPRSCCPVIPEANWAGCPRTGPAAPLRARDDERAELHQERPAPAIPFGCCSG